jgi:hypothetical protein
MRTASLAPSQMPQKSRECFVSFRGFLRPSLVRAMRSGGAAPTLRAA